MRLNLEHSFKNTMFLSNNWKTSLYKVSSEMLKKSNNILNIVFFINNHNLIFKNNILKASSIILLYTCTSEYKVVCILINAKKNEY